MRLFSNSEVSANDSNYSELKMRETHVDNANKSNERLIEEDSLLLQIDEFRRKAEALQNLINERQDRFLHLEETVRDRENKNYLLQNELEKKKEALQDVLDDVKSQFDILADRVDTSVNNAVNEAKEPVLEKIHTENVRLYRNIYDFIKEDYDTDEMEDVIKRNSNPNKGMITTSFVLGIINTVLIIIVLLSQLGIF